MTDHAVEQALSSASAVVDVSPLRAAWARRHEGPVRLAVVGRVGVGKSRLCSALTGQARSVGLGGTTDRPEWVHGGGFAVLDTPGIQAPGDPPVELLGETSVDAVVWLVDGLMPATATERGWLDRALPSGIGLHVLIGRADLVNDEDRDAVFRRLTRLSEPLQPLSIHWIDARAPADQAVAALRQVVWQRSPLRLRALKGALSEAAATLAHLPVPPDPSELAGELGRRWREAVRSCLETVIHEVRVGRRSGQEPARRALLASLREVLVPLRDDLQWETGAPLLWEPQLSPVGGGLLTGALGGPAAVIRRLRSDAAALAGAGEVAFLDAVSGPQGRGARLRRAAMLDARSKVDQVRRGLSEHLPDPSEGAMSEPESALAPAQEAP